MTWKQVIVASLIGGCLGFTAVAAAGILFSEKRAARACAAMGWQGYPEAYQQACIEGARWQSKQP